MGVLLGILGGGVPPGSPNPPFFVREFFSRALLCERLEQATLQETTGIPACLPSPPPAPAVGLSQSSLIRLRRSVQFLCSCMPAVLLSPNFSAF